MTPSAFDIRALKLIRQSVRKHIQEAAMVHDWEGKVVYDIAPQDYLGAKEFFHYAKVITFDKDAHTKPDYVLDLCQPTAIESQADCVICTEVLEHTANPFDAVKTIRQMLRPGGRAYVTTPYNFRIHGPLPDNWRFTEHGLRELFKMFSEVTIEEVSCSRVLMPVHYRLIAVK